MYIQYCVIYYVPLSILHIIFNNIFNHNRIFFYYYCLLLTVYKLINAVTILPGKIINKLDVAYLIFLLIGTCNCV